MAATHNKDFSGTNDRSIFGRLLIEARPYWPHLGCILLIDLLATPLALLTPVPLKIVVDSVLGSDPLPNFLSAALPAGLLESSSLLATAIGLLLATALLMQLQQLSAGYLRAYTGGKMVLDFRNTLFSHGQRLSLSRHDMKGTTDALYRIQYDTAAIENVAVHGLIPMIGAAVTVIAMIYVTLRINFQLAIIALAVAPAFIILTHFYRAPLRSRWREQKKLDHAAMSVINEVFAALRVVKAFTQEEREERRYSDSAWRGLRSKLNVTLWQGSFDLSASLVTAIGTGIVLFFGVRAIQAGSMTIGDLLIVMSYLSMLYAPLKKIGGRVAGLQSSLASAERAFELLDEDADVPERAHPRPIGNVQGRIEIRDVTFGYDPDVPVLEHVSLTIPAGTRVGIIGKTGAGKSTLISLLMRFYDPVDGDIILDGTSIGAFRLRDLRRQFSMVMQDTVLFSTSVRDNIAYARPEATDDEIVAAARSAGADGFISELKDGYDTLVGERGMRLSGGERQRISLARAFLRDAPILILDEPTSAVDTQTESQIMNAMAKLKKGRTTLMIAHRLGTLSDCQMLIRIEDRRVEDISDIADSIIKVAG